MMLYQLQEKLGILIKQFKRLKQSEKRLQTKVASLEATVEAQKKHISDLEEELMIKGMGARGDQQELVRYIDGIIQEIDNTIKKL